MKKVLIAVDDRKSSMAVLSTFSNLVKRPQEVVLVHVERLEGRSMMIDMLGDAELGMLKDSLRGTDHKETLDRRARKILGYYEKEFADGWSVRTKTILRDGHPAEEIVRLAQDEGAEMIILGYPGKKRLTGLMSGSVAKEVEKKSKVPVLVAKSPTVCEEPYTWRDAYYAVSFSSLIVIALFFLGRILERNGAVLP